MTDLLVALAGVAGVLLVLAWVTAPMWMPDTERAMRAELREFERRLRERDRRAGDR